MRRLERFSLVAVVMVAALIGSKGVSAHEVTPEMFSWLNSRSPSVFETFLRHKRQQMEMLPYFLVAMDVISPTLPLEYSVSGSNHLKEGQLWFLSADIGGVIGLGSDRWLRLGVDGRGLNMQEKGATHTPGERDSSDRSIDYLDVLLYADLCFPTWSIAAGAANRRSPRVELVEGTEVFVEPGENGRGITRWNGFAYVSLPYLEGGLIAGADGVTVVHARAPIPLRLPWFFDEFGPSVYVYPVAGFSEVGLFGDELPLWGEYLMVSVAAQAVAYPEPYLRQLRLKLVSYLFRDPPSARPKKRERSVYSDGYLRLEAYGSYFDLGSSAVLLHQSQPYGGGGTASYVKTGELKFGLSVGASYNYWEDLVVLPIPDQWMVRVSVWIGG